jgi:hypothetical protein
VAVTPSDTGEPATAFADKWQQRWPEWRIAEVFIARPQREVTVAWFALRQELLDAAWGGSDPRPGEAKLAWWAEELDGWARGRRRHPLGIMLQRHAAPWSHLAMAATSLPATRDAAIDTDAAAAALTPFAQATTRVDAVLFGVMVPASATDAIPGLLAAKIFLLADRAAPLQVRARMGVQTAEHAVARAWAAELLQVQQGPRGSRSQRVLAALERQRLQRFARGRPLLQPVPRWATLWETWRAARG